MNGKEPICRFHHPENIEMSLWAQSNCNPLTVTQKPVHENSLIKMLCRVHLFEKHIEILFGRSILDFHYTC